MTDGGTTPVARLEALTSLYERHAYVSWNVAFRTALEPNAAAAAARRAFLGQVTHPDESRLSLDTARWAAEGAAPVDSRAISDPVLSAAARLAPPQRAALAVAALTDIDGPHVAEAFGIEPAVEEELRARGCEQLGTLLGVSTEEARERYADLPWAEPPTELWEGLYPELHAAVTRHARAEAIESSAPDPPRARRSIMALAATRRIPRVALVTMAALAAAGVAWAATGGGGSDGGGSGGTPGGHMGAVGDVGDPGYSSDSGDSGSAEVSGPGLSPQELDRLRREELADLERYTRQRADRALPPRKRKRAAEKVDDLVKLAQQRQRDAERRELAARMQLAREREARARERRRRQQESEERADTGPESREPAEDPRPARPDPSPKPPDRPQDEPAEDEDQAECLYDAGSGAYICPE
jgi:hypothetical protein